MVPWRTGGREGAPRVLIQRKDKLFLKDLAALLQARARGGLWLHLGQYQGCCDSWGNLTGSAEGAAAHAELHKRCVLLGAAVWIHSRWSALMGAELVCKKI